MASWSNYGGNSVDIAAPGVSIRSTIPNNRYASWAGTSMASPQVAGLAALIKSYDSSLDWKEIKDIILKEGDQKSSFQGKLLSGKRINAFNSLASIRIVQAVLNLSGEKVLNRSLSQAEYINILRWESNPENRNLNIVNYRVYQIEGVSPTLLTELNSDNFEYWHRNVERDKQYTYSVVAVDNEGREGVPAYTVFK